MDTSEKIVPEKGSVEDPVLERDAWELHKVLSELLRVYQFRDRKRICYFDISVTQCYALSALMRKPMTLNRLSAALYLDKSTASRVIDTLERKGYVKRSVDPGDARALSLKVTDRGRELHGRIENDLANQMKDLIKDFDPDVRQAITRLVSRLAKAAAARFSGKGAVCGIEVRK